MNITVIKSLLKIKNSSVRINFLFLNDNGFNKKIICFLYKFGLIVGYKTQDNFLIIFFRYASNKKPLTDCIKIISGLVIKKHLSFFNICKLKNDKKIFCFSTNKGLLSAEECIRHKIGGTLLFLC